MNINGKKQKVLIWLGLAMSVFYGFAFLQLMHLFPPPSPSLGATEVAQLYLHANLQFRIGVVVMILSGAFYLPWSIVIAIQMAREEKGVPVCAIIQVVASAIGAWVFAFPAVMFGVCAFTADRAPEITLLMHQFAWLTFVTTGTWTLFQALPITVLALSSNKKPVQHSAFPRWFGWLTLWVNLIAEIATGAQLFNSGPFSWNGMMAFYLPLGAYAVWIGSMLVLLLRAIGRQQADGID